MRDMSRCENICSRVAAAVRGGGVLREGGEFSGWVFPIYYFSAGAYFLVLTKTKVG